MLELLFHQAEGDCIIDCSLEFENLFEQSELVAKSYRCLLVRIVFVVFDLLLFVVLLGLEVHNVEIAVLRFLYLDRVKI